MPWATDMLARAGLWPARKPRSRNRRIWREIRAHAPRRYFHSVRLLIRIARPGAKRFERLVAHHLCHGDFALRERRGQFMVNQGIIKADSGRVLSRVGKKDALRPRPIDGPQAHRTGLACAVQIASRQLKRLKLS